MQYYFFKLDFATVINIRTAPYQARNLLYGFGLPRLLTNDNGWVHGSIENTSLEQTDLMRKNFLNVLTFWTELNVINTFWSFWALDFCHYWRQFVSYLLKCFDHDLWNLFEFNLVEEFEIFYLGILFKTEHTINLNYWQYFIFIKFFCSISCTE